MYSDLIFIVPLLMAGWLDVDLMEHVEEQDEDDEDEDEDEEEEEDESDAVEEIKRLLLLDWSWWL